MITKYTNNRTAFENEFSFDNGYSVIVRQSNANMPGFCEVEVFHREYRVNWHWAFGYGFSTVMTTEDANSLVDSLEELENPL